MELKRVIVVGASAGGVEALRRIVAGLPADLNAAVIVVLHLRADAFSVLPAILDRAGPLPASHAEDREALEPGRVYVAPPDVHVVVRDGRISLIHGPTESGHRPAIDPLFRTAAAVYGERVVGVVLSGVLDDGTAGLAEISRMGGVAVVQSPTDALYAAMPRSALRRVDVDFVVPSRDIGPLLGRIVEETPPDGAPRSHVVSERVDDVVEQAIGDDLPASGTREGAASGLTCPDCQGALSEVHEGAITKFRCRVGHAWTEAGLLTEQAEALEGALRTARRVLGERADLARRIHDRALERGHERAADLFGERLEQFDHDARALHNVLSRPELLTVDDRLKEIAQLDSLDRGTAEEEADEAEASA
ncbi:MAG TPA: chemotaxis protein CheB [Acidimicrobiia bacterium]|jgi:two-component system chemotaxis response regulator CheB